MANKMLPSGISVRIREDLIDGASRVQTTLIIDPIITLGGHRVTMDDIGSIGYGKIDGGNSREEIISWTGITDNTTTYTLTGCTWGVNFHNLESSVSNRRRHTSGAKFEIKTDMHYITNQFRDNEDNVFTSEDPLVVQSTEPVELSANELKLGDGEATDKKISAINGDATPPYMKYDEATGKWLISNDGVNSYDPEDGGSGVTAGDAILIDGGAINVKTKETSGIHVSDDEVALEYQDDPGLYIEDNKLGVKVKSGTGLLKDADGIYNDSIDPDNPVAQSAGSLIGGTGHSDFSVFQDLGAGSNDGKFSINIDGTEYNNLSLDLSNLVVADIVQSAGPYQGYPIYVSNITGQIFTIVDKTSIESIIVYLGKTGSPTGDVYLDVYAVGGDNKPTGSVLYTKSLPISSIGGNTIFELNAELQAGKYCFIIRLTGGNSSNYIRTNRSNGSVYSGGDVLSSTNSGSTWTVVTDTDIVFQVKMASASVSLTNRLQSLLRATSGTNISVVYDTDHFVITSAHKGSTAQILKLMTPSTGTDISGNGLIPYLDMADNATEVLGTGDDYKLVRTNEDGVLPSEVIKDAINNVATAVNQVDLKDETNGFGTYDLTIDMGVSELNYFEMFAEIHIWDNELSPKGQRWGTLLIKGKVNGNNIVMYSSSEDSINDEQHIALSWTPGSVNIRNGLNGLAFSNTSGSRVITLTFNSITVEGTNLKINYTIANTGSAVDDWDTDLDVKYVIAKQI